ncbi:MAG: hypothetical protein PHX18_02720 [Candidatus Gastranaerophilales bacterium]|nr:hypothetical protein [Candidatus Gastranaerophilales bacterium]
MENNLQSDEITTVIKLLNNNISSQGYLEYLLSDDMRLVQVALLNIKRVSSQEEARAIFRILINHPSEIREYCSFLINKLMNDEMQRPFFQQKIFLDILEKAICDVNPKVCRNILEVLRYFDFRDELFSALIKNANNMVVLLQESNKQKNHMYTKNSFRLYWNLFGIALLSEYINYNNFREKLLKLIDDTVTCREYTIREKAALILKKLSRTEVLTEFEKYLNLLKNDENYYVKSVFKT